MRNRSTEKLSGVGSIVEVEICVAVTMCSELLDYAKAYEFGVPDVIGFGRFEIVHFVVAVPASGVVCDRADKLSWIEVLVDNLTKFGGQLGSKSVAQCEASHLAVFDHSLGVVFVGCEHSYSYDMILVISSVQSFHRKVLPKC